MTALCVSHGSLRAGAGTGARVLVCEVNGLGRSRWIHAPATKFPNNIRSVKPDGVRRACCWTRCQHWGNVGSVRPRNGRNRRLPRAASAANAGRPETPVRGRATPARRSFSNPSGVLGASLEPGSGPGPAGRTPIGHRRSAGRRLAASRIRRWTASDHSRVSRAAHRRRARSPAPVVDDDRTDRDGDPDRGAGARAVTARPAGPAPDAGCTPPCR